MKGEGQGLGFKAVDRKSSVQKIVEKFTKLSLRVKKTIREEVNEPVRCK